MIAMEAVVRGLGLDLVGVADLRRLEGMPSGLASGAGSVLGRYRYAIVLGAQLGKFGRGASVTRVNAEMERAALDVLGYVERTGHRGLIVHTEDEFDPVGRFGLLSLKVLAKDAGLGWQGRSLLIISPEHGPVHRWIAVLTDLELRPGAPVPNRCGECTACVDECPYDALRLVRFDDHPERREDVLDTRACRGDDGCQVCLDVCPWAK